LIFDLAESVSFLYFGWYSTIWNKLCKKFGLYIAIVLFFSLMTIKSTLLEMPFTAFSHFYIEKKYGFNNMTFKLFINDTIKSTLLTTIMYNALMIIVEVIISKFGDKFFFVLWIAFFVFMFVLLTIHPLYIAPLFNKFEPLNIEDPKEKEL
jgi:STE24 endopeptidase